MFKTKLENLTEIERKLIELAERSEGVLRLNNFHHSWHRLKLSSSSVNLHGVYGGNNTTSIEFNGSFLKEKIRQDLAKEIVKYLESKETDGFLSA